MSSDLYWFIVADRNVGHGRVLSLVRNFSRDDFRICGIIIEKLALLGLDVYDGSLLICLRLGFVEGRSSITFECLLEAWGDHTTNINGLGMTWPESIAVRILSSSLSVTMHFKAHG
mmetsp:Transcript_6239/g.12856  ORF Transcript_6239/g.12856 Transcript_6239/m.12856 type:complete len:116 (-) Transcript_6239:164-511(-)